MNIGIFRINQTQGWVKLEDYIKKYQPNFSFVMNESYKIQLLSGNVVLSESTNAPNGGYLFDDLKEVFTYVKGQGDLYIKTTYRTATFNIGDDN